MYKNEKLSTLNIQKKLCTLRKKLCSLNIEIKKIAYIEHTKLCMFYLEKNKRMLNLKFVYFESLNIINSVH